MKLGKRYSRNLVGVNAQGFVPAVDAAIAAGSSIGEVVRDAALAEGTVGILTNGSTSVSALTAGDVFKILQKQNGSEQDAEIRSSIELNWDDVVVTKQAYEAPVLQVDEAPITAAAIDAILAVPGLKEFVASSRETTPANQPFPVVEGRSVVRNATTTAYNMFAALVRQINGDFDYERNSDDNFAIAGIANDAIVGAISVAANVSLSKGSNIATFDTAPTGIATGQYLSIVPAGGVTADVFLVTDLTGAVATLDRVWGYDSQVVLVANLAGGAAVSGDWTLSFTGADTGIHFSSITAEDLADFAFATTQAWKQGSGDYASVAAMEEEFSVFQGATTINAQWREDYGEPTRFADPTKTYDTWILKYKKRTPSMAFANEEAHHMGYVILTAEAGGTLAGVLDTVFGTV